MKKSALGLLASTSFLVLSHCTVLAQGSLTPPGAPAPTMRTLLEIEPRTPISSLPFTIATAGAYYLAGNLTGTNGITIAADNVDLDLMGFTLSGLPGSGSGIYVPASQINLTVRNGNIVNWQARGLDATNAANARLERLRASSNRLDGLSIGVSGLVDRCEAIRNLHNGILAGDGSLVRDCVTRTNGTGNVLNAGGTGIACGTGATVIGCVSVQNADFGIIVGDASVVTGCIANQNGWLGLQTGAGIKAGNSCTIVSCIANTNSLSGQVTGNGIVTGDASTVRDCTATRNSIGVGTGNHSTVQGCTTDYAVSVGLGAGISAHNFSLVRDCLANRNSYNGIVAGGFCLVQDNLTMGSSHEPDILMLGSRNVIIHNVVGAMNQFHEGGIGTFGVSNAVGTIENADTLNTNRNPHANITP